MVVSSFHGIYGQIRDRGCHFVGPAHALEALGIWLGAVALAILEKLRKDSNPQPPDP